MASKLNASMLKVNSVFEVTEGHTCRVNPTPSIILCRELILNS